MEYIHIHGGGGEGNKYVAEGGTNTLHRGDVLPYTINYPTYEITLQHRRCRAGGDSTGEGEPEKTAPATASRRRQHRQRQAGEDSTGGGEPGGGGTALAILTLKSYTQT